MTHPRTEVRRLRRVGGPEPGAGSLTPHPTPECAPVAQFGLGVSRRWKNGAGELQESPVFVEVVAWGKQAETVATYLTKGRPVVVERLPEPTLKKVIAEARIDLSPG